MARTRRRRESVAERECDYDENSRTWSRPGARCRTDRVDKDRIEYFGIVAEHFRQDIGAFWTHATFYVVLQGAIATVFVNVAGPHDATTKEGLISHQVLAFLVSLAGALFALAWALASRGRQKLIGEWRDQVLHQEALAFPDHLSYRHVERVAKESWLEPTRITFVIPIVVALAWAAMAGWTGYHVW